MILPGILFNPVPGIRNTGEASIITPDLIRRIVKKLYREKARKPGRHHNLWFRVSRTPITIGMTVTDTSLSFGLFARDKKTCDPICDLVCPTRNAQARGERIFR